MVKPPQLLPLGYITHLLSRSPALLVALGGAVVAYLAYRFVYRIVGLLKTLFALALAGGAVYGIVRLHVAIAAWQHSMLHPAKHAHTAKAPGGIVNPLSVAGSTLNTVNPLAHENAWLIAIALVVVVLWGIGYLMYRGLSPTTRAMWLSRMNANASSSTRRRKQDNVAFPIAPIEVGVRKDNGKPVVIDGKDRFINTLILGSTGTGKTSKVLKKAAFQDIRSIADGLPMDVIVMDPDGGFAEDVAKLAKQLNVRTDIIDLRGHTPSTVSFNPLSGGSLADVIDNVRAAMQEKMGKQEGFFQNAQDDLVRTVLLVQLPLWPSADFQQFADLVTDALHFRAVCKMVQDCVTPPAPSSAGKTNKKNDDFDDLLHMWDHERDYIEARFQQLSPTEQKMVFAQARSFVIDTRNEKKMEQLEAVTKGLKIVVNELATNPRLAEAFSTKDLPALDFRGFLNAGKEERGRLLTVITGNHPAGKLFGKLFLVTLKMYTLDRSGIEDSRRPVYLYVDEFPVYGTEAYTEMFSQARKYRVGQMLAIQARAQLLDVSKKFMDVVEGNCRNKVFFPAPSPDDARFLETSLGTTTTIRETHTENKLNWFGFDGRNRDPRISTQETVDPRYRLEDIAYGLSKDEALFAMTVDNQAVPPFVGLTSFAEEWASHRRHFYTVEEPKIGKVSRRAKRATPNAEPVIETATVPTKSAAATSMDESAATARSASGNELVKPEVLEAAQPARTATYVKPDADPTVVIRLDDALRRMGKERRESAESTALASVEKAEAQEIPVTPEIHESQLTAEQPETPMPIRETTPTIQRFDLRKRTTANIPTDSAESERRECPKCQRGYLELTAEGTKWRCTTCGFERKNRKHTTDDSES